MLIHIPTRGRISKQNSYHSFPLEMRKSGQVVLVAPPEEVPLHEKQGRICIARPEGYRIAKTRQWICEERAVDNKVIMVDDDLAFFVRKDPDSYRLRPARTDEIETIFLRIWNNLDRFAMAGLSPRQMNNVHFPDEEIFNTKINAVQGVRTDLLRKIGARYDDVDIMEDYHVVLSFLERGYGNAVLVDCAWDQVALSGSAGGCSLYRTPEVQTAGSHHLSQLHPDFVKVVEKAPRTGWAGMATRIDVRVQWAKAFKDGAAKYGYPEIQQSGEVI
jgi:hypothetical protein